MNIERVNAHCFKTPDGAAHPTWNAARKHLTKIAFCATLTHGLPPMSYEQALRIADVVFRNWHVSRLPVSEVSSCPK